MFSRKLPKDLRRIHLAARSWFGREDMNSLCLAENKLARGETPPPPKRKGHKPKEDQKCSEA